MRMIFPNLPVSDVQASRAFFGALGFSFNDDFSDDSTAAMVVEENIIVMLMSEEKFRGFIQNEIAPRNTTESLLCLSCDSRADVEELGAKAKAAGAGAWKDPMDHGFMYGESFTDLDGHVWEIMWMDVEAAQKAQQAQGASA